MNEYKRIGVWLNNPSHLLVLAIIIFAFFVNLHFFLMTNHQTFWWDESEYMATAQHLASGTPDVFNFQRPILFQIILAGGMQLGLGEVGLRFLCVFLPLLALIFVIYLLGSSLFTPRVGIIAAFLSSSIWSFVFWATRMQPDFLSLTFQLLAFYFIWKFYRTSRPSLALYAGIAAGLGLHFKVSALLVPFIILLYSLFHERLHIKKILTSKGYWSFALGFLLTLSPYIIWSLIKTGKILAFIGGYGSGSSQGWNYGWYTLTFLYSFPRALIFCFFVIGLVLSLRHFLIFDRIWKSNERLQGELLCILSLVVVAFFYIVYIRGDGPQGIEDRWVFLFVPFIFYIASIGLTKLVDSFFASSLLKIIIIVILLSFSSYSQLSQASQLIEQKRDSYLPVKEAGLWLRSHSDVNATIFSMSLPQTLYYSARTVVTYSQIPSPAEFDALILTYRPSYLQVSVFERQPIWMQAWITNHGSSLSPVDVYYADATKKNALLITYAFV